MKTKFVLQFTAICFPLPAFAIAQYPVTNPEGICLNAQGRKIPSVIVRLHAKDQTGANSLNRYFRTK
jgi:hypothetical protein